MGSSLPRLCDFGENDLLAQLLQDLPQRRDLLVGPGDDCAVVRQEGSPNDLLLKTDCVVEGIHFTRETPPELVGRKALARCLSDIASMGGTPEQALVTLFVHSQRPVDDIQRLYAGLTELAREWDVAIAGGETSSLPFDSLIVNISLTGSVPNGEAILRSTAQVGDFIAVTGALGGSFPSQRHLLFTPRVNEGKILRELQIPSAMMDLSDGLAQDLPRLAKASQVGFHLDLDKLPCHEGVTTDEALRDGEDYELLLTIPENKLALVDQFRQRTDVPITLIGRITDPLSHSEELAQGGWQHFQSHVLS
jgi:thiamine-monophosphate kinase